MSTQKWNRAYKPLINATERFQVVYGGAGSGKSHAVAQRTIKEVTGEPGIKYLIVRKVAKTLRFSVFALLQHIIEEWGIGRQFKVNKSDMTLTHVNGSQIICLGLDDVEKLKSILGITRVWVEEATEVTFDDFTQLDLRMRGKSPISHQMVLTFNPIDHLHWAKAHFFDEPKDNAQIIHTTYKDNAFLDAEYRQQLEKLREVDAYYYQVYCLGEWGQVGNRVFSNYVIEDFPYYWELEKDNDGKDIPGTRHPPEALENNSHGMDFGYNHASTLMSIGFRDGELYVWDERWYRELTNPEFIDAVRDTGFPKTERVIGDSAEPARLKEWQKAGYNVHPARKGKDSLLMGIDWLKARKIHIHKTRCPQTAREIQTLKYREDKDGNVLEEIVQINDDCIAGIRYATEELWNKKVMSGEPDVLQQLAGLLG